MKSTNARHVKAAKKALAHYHTNDPYSEDSHVIDLLTDLRHYCDDKGLSFADLDRIAYGHYVEERVEANHGDIR